MAAPAPEETVENAIRVIRRERVMLDSDQARFYAVATKRLLEQRRRNAARLPDDFAFQLTPPYRVSSRVSESR